MASPSVSTPSSAGSPGSMALAPQPLAIKTTSSANKVTFGPLSVNAPGLITRKEWIVPPRPKPGRKPATDTPPTKRKAQNRAAQRAFRERRAARVGELEENLEEVKEDQQQREVGFINKIAKLEADVARFSGEVQSWKVRCDTLDRIADYERRQKEVALTELSYLRNGHQSTGTDAVPLPPRHLRQPDLQSTKVAKGRLPNGVSDSGSAACGDCTSMDACACLEQAIAISATGCGQCSVDTHCQCLEDTIKEAAALPALSDPKRPRSPWDDNIADKRLRQSGPSTPLEIDFTARFASKPVVQAQADLNIQSRSGDSCGFCEEGTYCMCAEAAAVASTDNATPHENRLAPILDEVTPPPSDTDADGSCSFKLPPLQPNLMHRALPTSTSANPCANGPGTCQQCQADPRSGLFCRSLATMRTARSSGTEGCCGGGTSSGGCCKSAPTAVSSELPPRISCADTYMTLSTHKNFDQASDELNTWLGRLHASPPSHTGRAPMEVEAASVMGVLKLFDRRFGRG